jgi:hypothetical protein
MSLCEAHGSNCSQDPLHLDVILKRLGKCHYTTLNCLPHLASVFAILVSLAYIFLFGLSSVIYYILNLKLLIYSIFHVKITYISESLF